MQLFDPLWGDIQTAMKGDKFSPWIFPKGSSTPGNIKNHRGILRKGKVINNEEKFKVRLKGRAFLSLLGSGIFPEGIGGEIGVCKSRKKRNKAFQRGKNPTTD